MSRWPMTPLAVFTGARAETLTRVWWPDRWGRGIRPHCGQIIYTISCCAAKSYSPSVSLGLIYLISGWTVRTAGDPGLGTMCWQRGLELPNGTLLMEDYTHISGGDSHNVFWPRDCCNLCRWRQSSTRFEVRTLFKKVLFNFLFDISQIANSLSLYLSI